jgi:hypothetical protein
VSNLSGISHDDLERLKVFKDIHWGQRAFIIGNGPSLTANDLELLQDEITFAANKIYLFNPETRFRPTYYASVDLIFLEHFYPNIQAIEAPKFLPNTARRWVKPSKQLFFFQEIGAPKDQKFTPRFSLDIQQGIYGGFTVSYTLIQLAFYMGIRELYLIGMDHDYQLPGQRSFHPAYGEVLVSEGEVNHFHRNYRPPGEIWSIPRPECQEQAYRLAMETFQRFGGAIFNVTRGGKLDIFPRKDLTEIL